MVHMDREIAKFRISDFSIGDRFSFQEVIRKKMVDDFAALSGDYSSLHMDDKFAKGRSFIGRVVHGVLLTSLLSRLVGMHFPGENAVIQSMNSRFVTPGYIGDRLRVTAEIDQISIATKTIVLNALIENTSTEKILVRSKLQVGFTE